MLELLSPYGSSTGQSWLSVLDLCNRYSVRTYCVPGTARASRCHPIPLKQTTTHPKLSSDREASRWLVSEGMDAGWDPGSPHSCPCAAGIGLSSFYFLQLSNSNMRRTCKSHSKLHLNRTHQHAPLLSVHADTVSCDFFPPKHCL